MATTDLVLDIEGMTCASCVQKVERALGDVDGVQAAAVNLAARTATVQGEVDGFEPLIGAVARVGYGARPHDDDVTRLQFGDRDVGLAAVAWLDLPVPRRLKTLRGSLDELLTDARFTEHEDAWVCAQYTDATPQLDPMRRLQARFAFCATVMHTPEGLHGSDGLTYSRRVRSARSSGSLGAMALRRATYSARRESISAMYAR